METIENISQALKNQKDYSREFERNVCENLPSFINDNSPILSPNDFSIKNGDVEFS